jgi:hypothetical protein
MKPILCNTQVVQNILASRQTQDRRPIKFKKGLGEFVDKDDAWQWAVHNSTGPKYQVGDVLYVRETFCETTFIQCARTNNWDYEIIDGQRNDNGVLGNYAKCIMYRTHELSCPVGKWKPNIHMPKKFARIFLKVTAVRVERIQDISIEDAMAEGVDDMEAMHTCAPASIAYIGVFSALWDSIYPGSWERNDWVFVYDFERCEKPPTLRSK